MMRLLLDTNRYTDLDRSIADVVAKIAQATEVCIPFIVLAEPARWVSQPIKTRRERTPAQSISIPRWRQSSVRRRIDRKPIRRFQFPIASPRHDDPRPRHLDCALCSSPI